MGFDVSGSGQLKGELSVTPVVKHCPCCGSETYNTHTTTDNNGMITTTGTCLDCRNKFCSKCYNTNLP